MSDEAILEHDRELGLGFGPFAWGHFPLGRGIAQDEIDQLGCGFVGRKMASDFDRSPELCVQGFDRICNRYEDGRCGSPAASLRRGLCCEHPGQRHREHEGAGRPMYTMSRELALVAGRLCDSPGCAESADP